MNGVKQMQAQTSDLPHPAMKTIRQILTSLCALLLQFSSVAAPGDLDPLDADVVGEFVLTTAVQPDGKIIIGGKFTSVLGVPRSNIARLNANGSIDMDFDPKANGQVISVAVQGDGKIVLGGTFTTLQPNGAATPTARQYVARVNADGSLDSGFDPKPGNTVTSVVVQADGRIVLGGGIRFAPAERGRERGLSAVYRARERQREPRHGLRSQGERIRH